MRAKLEIVAMVLGFLGLFGTITSTVTPTWKVSAFIGANIIVMEDLWEGLWMACFRQANIKMQCKAYYSQLILPPELQAARGLMCISIVLVIIALFITGCGTQRCNCGNMKSKNIILIFGACLYLLSFFTTLIPVSWVTHTIIYNFYNPAVVDAEKREMGVALYIGWASSAVLLLTGILLLVSYTKRKAKEEEPYTVAYTMAAPTANSINREPSLHKHHQYV